MYTLLVQPRPQLAYMCVNTDYGRHGCTASMGVHTFKYNLFGLAGPVTLMFILKVKINFKNSRSGVLEKRFSNG